MVNIRGAFFMQSTIGRIEEQILGLTMDQANRKMGIYMFRRSKKDGVKLHVTSGNYIPNRLTVETVDDVITKVVEFG